MYPQQILTNIRFFGNHLKCCLDYRSQDVSIFFKKWVFLITKSWAKLSQLLERKWAKVERKGISWFCLTVRHDAHEVGHILIKNDHFCSFSWKPEMLKMLVFFCVFSETLVWSLMCFLENGMIFKGKPHMILLKKLVITKYQQIIKFVYFVCFFCKKWAPNDHKWGVQFWGRGFGRY